MSRSGDASVRLAARECVDTEESNTCEKPTTSQPVFIAIVVGIGLLLVVVTLVTLVYLHFRRRRLDRQEDAAMADHELSDWDVDELPVKARQRQRQRQQQQQQGEGHGRQQREPAWDGDKGPLGPAPEISPLPEIKSTFEH